jgi:hypothetical protein
LVAAITRVSTRTSLSPPSRENSPSWSTCRSFACSAGCISLISSRKIAPWFAYSNLPSLRFCAPVNAPFSNPNSSLSSSSEGSAAQFTFTNGWSRRPESWKIVRATSSLPVPLSPRTSTVMSVSATCSMISRTSRIFGLSPHSSSSSVSERARPRSRSTSCLSARFSSAFLERQLELLDLERLAQEVGSAQAHRLDDVAAWPVPREHHDRDVGRSLLEPAQRLEAVHARQHHVERHDVRAGVVQSRERLLRRRPPGSTRYPWRETSASM